MTIDLGTLVVYLGLSIILILVISELRARSMWRRSQKSSSNQLDRTSVDPQPTLLDTSSDPEPIIRRPILTQREWDIVELVARGFTNKEIAEQLGITSDTVATHLKKIYRKLDVDSRVSLTQRVKDIVGTTGLPPDIDCE